VISGDLEQPPQRRPGRLLLRGAERIRAVAPGAAVAVAATQRAQVGAACAKQPAVPQALDRRREQLGDAPVRVEVDGVEVAPARAHQRDRVALRHFEPRAARVEVRPTLPSCREAAQPGVLAHRRDRLVARVVEDRRADGGHLERVPQPAHARRGEGVEHGERARRRAGGLGVDGQSQRRQIPLQPLLLVEEDGRADGQISSPFSSSLRNGRS